MRFRSSGNGITKIGAKDTARIWYKQIK
jgi:hypothetical protein